MPEANPFLPESLEVLLQRHPEFELSVSCRVKREGLDAELMQKLEEQAGQSFVDLDEILKKLDFRERPWNAVPSGKLWPSMPREVRFC